MRSKRGDIGSTAQHYASEAFDRYGADAVMLSGETSVGKFPLEAVQTMARIVTRMERDSTGAPLAHMPRTKRGVISYAARDIGERLDAKALIAFTSSGDTVRRLARLHSRLPLLAFVTDIDSIGLETAQGLVCTETFYWDLNDRTRAFTQRVLPSMPGQLRPGMAQAGCYSAVMHYLKTVAEMGVPAAKASGVDTVNRMKAQPTNDDAMGQGTIRPDGRRIQPSYLLEVKTLAACGVHVTPPQAVEEL